MIKDFRNQELSVFTRKVDANWQWTPREESSVFRFIVAEGGNQIMFSLFIVLIFILYWPPAIYSVHFSVYLCFFSPTAHTSGFNLLPPCTKPLATLLTHSFALFVLLGHQLPVEQDTLTHCCLGPHVSPPECKIEWLGFLFPVFFSYAKHSRLTPVLEGFLLSSQHVYTHSFTPFPPAIHPCIHPLMSPAHPSSPWPPQSTHIAPRS